MSKLTRDGTAEPVSRDQILRRERGQRIFHFLCSAADHEQDCQPCPVVRAMHTNIVLHTHTAVDTYIYSRCPGLPASSLPVCPVYRCFFFVPPRHPGLPVVCRYTGVVHFFMLAEPLLLLHTPTHAAAHNTAQPAGCCGQHPTLAYTPCHVRQENYANLVTALSPQNSPAAAHAEVACTAFAVILMTTRKSTASANHALQQRSLLAVPMTISKSVEIHMLFLCTCGHFPRYTGLPCLPVLFGLATTGR